MKTNLKILLYLIVIVTILLFTSCTALRESWVKKNCDIVYETCPPPLCEEIVRINTSFLKDTIYKIDSFKIKDTTYIANLDTIKNNPTLTFENNLIAIYAYKLIKNDSLVGFVYDVIKKPQLINTKIPNTEKFIATIDSLASELSQSQRKTVNYKKAILLKKQEIAYLETQVKNYKKNNTFNNVISIIKWIGFVLAIIIGGIIAFKFLNPFSKII